MVFVLITPFNYLCNAFGVLGWYAQIPHAKTDVALARSIRRDAIVA